MEFEPITVFSRIADPALVAKKLREFSISVKIDGTDHSWRHAVVTVGSWWRKRTLTFTHDPDYYSEPGWSQQMDGMRGYFSRFPNSDRKPQVLMLISTFRFSLGTLFSPDFDPSGDPRLDVLYAITETLDGVLFTPSSLRDAHGRILLTAEGEEFEDPEAKWPRVAAEVSIEESQGGTGGENEPSDPPTAERVARRALALSAVTVRGILEMELQDARAGDTYDDLIQWVADCGIESEIEPDEWAVLQRPLGKLDGQDQVNACWRLEGLVVLAWALGLFEIPPHDELVETNPLWDSLKMFDVDGAVELLSNPTLRPRSEIETLQRRLFALHWRLRNYRVNPGVIDFAEYAETCWFGPLNISGFPLKGGDLALQGDRIDRASPDLFSRTESAAKERHQAVNWLVDGPTRYADASIST